MWLAEQLVALFDRANRIDRRDALLCLGAGALMYGWIELHRLGERVAEVEAANKVVDVRPSTEIAESRQREQDHFQTLREDIGSQTAEMRAGFDRLSREHEAMSGRIDSLSGPVDRLFE